MINYDKEKLNLDKITSNDLPYLEKLLERKWFAVINSTKFECKYKFITQIFSINNDNIIVNYIVFKKDYNNKNIQYIDQDTINISYFLHHHKEEDYTAITEIKNYIKELEEDLDL